MIGGFQAHVGEREPARPTLHLSVWLCKLMFPFSWALNGESQSDLITWLFALGRQVKTRERETGLLVAPAPAPPVTVTERRPQACPHPEIMEVGSNTGCLPPPLLVLSLSYTVFE